MRWVYWQVQLVKKVHYCALLAHHLADTVSPGCSLASNRQVRSSKRRMKGIPGIHIIADDIIIAASSNQEHDQILTQVMQRAKERNTMFNLNKLQFVSMR